MHSALVDGEVFIITLVNLVRSLGHQVLNTVPGASLAGDVEEGVVRVLGRFLREVMDPGGGEGGGQLGPPTPSWVMKGGRGQLLEL